MLILYLLLLLQVISNWLAVWFLYKLLPEEKQEKIKQAKEQILHPLNEGKVMEWAPPKSELELAEEEAMKSINLK